MLTRFPSSAQPYCATKWLICISRVTPCRGSFEVCAFIIFSPDSVNGAHPDNGKADVQGLRMKKVCHTVLSPFFLCSR
nr:MAG TPA_asm: hypothetical protein [Caudoviricetes sp.]